MIGNFLLAAFLIIVSAFFNYLLALYSGVNLSKIDLTQINKKKKEERKWKGFNYILKNIYLFRVVNSFLQLVLNLFISVLLMSELKGLLDGKLTWKKWKWGLLLISEIFIFLCTDLLILPLANQNNEEKALNEFFLNTAYGLTFLFGQLNIVKPKSSLLNSSEPDLVRFIRNLTTEGILEDKEAKLVVAALAFDEIQAEKFLVPWRKIICLTDDMTYQEVQEVYLKTFFTNYPVLNEKGKIVGVFNYTIFNWMRLKEKDGVWQNYITEEVVVASHMKLSEVFEKLQQRNCQIAIIQEENEIRGVITIKDILGTLVGKLRDEKEKLFSLYPNLSATKTF